jgi:hypothetical protein
MEASGVAYMIGSEPREHSFQNLRENRSIGSVVEIYHVFHSFDKGGSERRQLLATLSF